jgi:nucleoside-diphosphate-sugar epimerase
MRVFVTGATGFVGGAVVPELISAGHSVLGLTRSEEGAKALAAMGAEAHRGTLQDLAALEAGARNSDGVIHLAIETIGTALQGSERPLLVTSGLALLAPGRIANEGDTPSPQFPRASERAAEAVAERGVRATAVRLAPSTHGAGDHGFVPILIGIAREKGVAAYIGDGGNRWPGVHRHDAARLYRLALEHGAQGGPYHAVDEEGVPFKAIAETIGRGLNLPVASISPEEAEAHFGWFTMFAGMDIPTSSERTRNLLDWEPREIGLLADIEAHYFGA